MTKIIKITNCADCPYTEKLFSKTHTPYCKKLAKFERKISYFVLMPLSIVDGTEFPIPEIGFLDNCPLENEIPIPMSDEEWELEKEKGLLWIETIPKDETQTLDDLFELRNAKSMKDLKRIIKKQSERVIGYSKGDTELIGGYCILKDGTEQFVENKNPDKIIK
jgi:hypothetical protein